MALFIDELVRCMFRNIKDILRSGLSTNLILTAYESQCKVE